MATAKCLLIVRDSSEGTPDLTRVLGVGQAGREGKEGARGDSGVPAHEGGLFPAGDGQEVHPAVLPTGVGGAVPPRHAPSSQHEPGEPGGPRGTHSLSLETRQVTPSLSQVDVENPDLEKFPRFAEAPFLSCVLSPGEVLFIPVKHWHYVRALDLSFSVSFWWS